MTQKNNRRDNRGHRPDRRPLQQEFIRRSDGRWNFWHRRYVHGYSFGKENLVWVIRGVYRNVPAWGAEYVREA